MRAIVINLNLGCDCRPGPPVEAIEHVGPVTYRDPFPFLGRPALTPTEILDDQETVLHFPPKLTDAAGNDFGAYAGPVAWSADNPAAMTFKPSADGLTCQAVTTGVLGPVVASGTVTTAKAGPATLHFAFNVAADTQTVVGTITADPPTSRLAPATAAAGT